MKIYIICPARRIIIEQQIEIDDYISMLKLSGDLVHSYKDVNQDDPTGYNIVIEHMKAMEECDEVHVFWDKESTGSHFDLGMAMILGKKINLLKSYQPEGDVKSYLKVIKEYIRKK